MCVEADARQDSGNKLEALGVGLLVSFLLNLSSQCFSSAHHHSGFEKKKNLKTLRYTISFLVSYYLNPKQPHGVEIIF